MRPISQNLVELVNLLGDGEYHDGTSIGDHLKISRAAVWKLIKKLTHYDIDITRTKGKGYQLTSPLILLNKHKLKNQLRHQAVNVTVFEKITSTNDYLKSLSKNNKKIIAGFAEAQTAGKGRLHRQWYSPFAENIYLSVLYPFANDISELSGLSLVAALAICHAVESVVNLHELQLSIKWPNDILINQDKLAGTLIEIEAESHGFCQVIIGVGMNVNMQKGLKKDIDQRWTSLAKLTNQYIDRNLLGAEMIDTLIDYLERFAVQGLSGFMQEWQQRDCLADAMVSVRCGSKKAKGICLGINHQGHLTIKAESGDILTLSSGDTTLLK